MISVIDDWTSTRGVAASSKDFQRAQNTHRGGELFRPDQLVQRSECRVTRSSSVV